MGVLDAGVLLVVLLPPDEGDPDGVVVVVDALATVTESFMPLVQWPGAPQMK